MNFKKIKKIILDILSFGTPQAIVINLSSIMIILAVIPVDKLNYLPIRSVYESVFHLHLYSSGQTRAISSLLHGDILDAWQFNKLVYLLFAVMLMLIVINLSKSIKYYRRTGNIYPT